MNREKFLPLVTIAVCCVVTFFLAKLILVPLESDTLLLQVQARQLSAQVNELTAFEKRHGDIEKFVTVTETHLAETYEFLPPEPSQESFVVEIYRIADELKVLVNAVQIGDIENVDENFCRQSVRIRIETDYVSMLNFLREILDGNRFVTIENITLESHENVLSGDLELSIFSLAATR